MAESLAELGERTTRELYEKHRLARTRRREELEASLRKVQRILDLDGPDPKTAEAIRAIRHLSVTANENTLEHWARIIARSAAQ